MNNEHLNVQGEMSEEDLSAVVGGVSLIEDSGIGALRVSRMCSRCGKSFSADARVLADSLCPNCRDGKIHIIPKLK